MTEEPATMIWAPFVAEDDEPADEEESEEPDDDEPLEPEVDEATADEDPEEPEEPLVLLLLELLATPVTVEFETPLVEDETQEPPQAQPALASFE